MIVYRITLEKWAYRLYASGYAARWNYNNQRVIYTASSRSLACLENMVHRNGRGLNANFRTMIIDIPDDLDIQVIEQDSLSEGWNDVSEQSYDTCREIGAGWVAEAKRPVMKVPSAIISNEYNYLVNMHHPLSDEVKILGVEPFIFDPRLKKL